MTDKIMRKVTDTRAQSLHVGEQHSGKVALTCTERGKGLVQVRLTEAQAKKLQTILNERFAA